MPDQPNPNLADSLRRTAEQLRAFWAEDSGTSLHLSAAELMDVAADRLATLRPTGDERALIVTRLRERAREWREDGYYNRAFALFNEADAIEAGDHLPPVPPECQHEWRMIWHGPYGDHRCSKCGEVQ